VPFGCSDRAGEPGGVRTPEFSGRHRGIAGAARRKRRQRDAGDKQISGDLEGHEQLVPIGRVSGKDSRSNDGSVHGSWGWVRRQSPRRRAARDRRPNCDVAGAELVRPRQRTSGIRVVFFTVSRPNCTSTATSSGPSRAEKRLLCVTACGNKLKTECTTRDRPGRSNKNLGPILTAVLVAAKDEAQVRREPAGLGLVKHNREDSANHRGVRRGRLELLDQSAMLFVAVRPPPAAPPAQQRW